MIEFSTSALTAECGVEKLNHIVARGVLIDVTAIWGWEMKAGDLITLEHVDKALAAQGMSDFKLRQMTP